MDEDRSHGVVQVEAFLLEVGRLERGQLHALADAAKRESVGRLALSTDPQMLAALASGCCSSVDVRAHRYVRESTRRTARALLPWRPLRQRAVARVLEHAALVVLLDAGLTFLEQPSLRQRLAAAWIAAMGADPSTSVRVPALV